MSTTPRDVLIEIVSRHGESLLASPLRCEGLLKDYCGEFRREIFVLVSCLRVGVVDQLRRQNGPSVKLICARLALKLEQNLAISGDVAKWAVETWAVALGMLNAANATTQLSTIFDPASRGLSNETAEIPRVGPVTDYATETPPVPTMGIAAQPEEIVEYLAQEPDPHWQLPDWTQPAMVIDVYPDASGQKPGLREAIHNSGDHACLVLKAGIYRESLVIKKNVQIRAEDGAEVTLESLTASVVVLEGACLLLCRLIIKGIGGKDKKAQAAVEVKSGHLEIEDCDLTSDSSTVVEVKGGESEAYLYRCHLHDGKAGGILFQEDAVGYLEECHLYQNKLSQVVIGKGSSPVLSGCKISHALMAGIYVSEGGEGFIENCDIWGNAVSGVQCRRGGNPHLRYCRISANERCGVLVAEQGEGLFEHCQIFDNARMGVSVGQQSKPRFSACQIFDNRGMGAEVIEQAQGEWLDCEIFANETTNLVVKGKSAPQLYRCIIHDGHKEGLMVTESSEGLFEGCEFHANALTGILVTQNAKPVFQKCVLHHGSENGVTVHGAEGQFVDCEITHHAGTAVLVAEQGQTRFERCHIVENQATGVHVDAASPLFLACVIAQNGGTGFVCSQSAAPRMTEGEISENGAGLVVESLGKGRWEQVQFLANHGDSVRVIDGGRPALRLCHVQDAEEVGLRFQNLGLGTIEDVDIVGSVGPGIQIETGGNPSLRQIRVKEGHAAGIVVQAQGSATLEDCEASENAGGDWSLDPNARLVRVGA